MSFLEFDVHGYSIEVAIRRIQRLIIDHPDCTCIEIIHGYNNGNAIKRVLSNAANIHSRRVIKTLPVPFNEGRTMIFLKM